MSPNSPYEISTYMNLALDSSIPIFVVLLWCNGPVEDGTLGLRVDEGTSGRNVDDDALSSE